MKRANVASSDGAGDLVGECQARTNTAPQGYPNHVGDPKRHVPWQSHDLRSVLLEIKMWIGIGEFQSEIESIEGIELKLEEAIGEESRGSWAVESRIKLRSKD